MSNEQRGIRVVGPVSWNEKFITVNVGENLSIQEKNRVNKIAKEWGLDFEVSIHARHWYVYTARGVVGFLNGRICLPRDKGYFYNEKKSDTRAN